MIEKGIWFGGVHSYLDFDLILTDTYIPPASPKETYIEIPGANGSIDMTEAHGEVKYNDRTGAKFTFAMNPAGDLSESAWEAKKTEVCNRLNGLRCDIVLDKDPDYYWQGRCKVNEHASNKKIRRIVVGARLSPYKMKSAITRNTVELTEAPKEITLKNSRKRVCPSIICTGEATLSINGATYTMNEGSHKILDFQLKEGANAVTVSGTGMITFEYQECDL